MYGHRWFLRLGESSDANLFALMNEASELIHCDHSFYQGVDAKGQAQTNVRVGNIVATYDGLPSSDTIEWALDSRRYMNGAIILYDANDIPLSKMFFQDAACVGLHLSFSNAGKTSILTQIKITPRKLTSGDVTIDQHWINVSSSSRFSSTEAAAQALANKFFKLAQPLSKLSLDMMLDGTEYEIQDFAVGFDQPIDSRGEPQNEVHGGAIKFTVPSMPDKTLHQWMMQSDMRKSGEFVFKRGDENSPLRVEFADAYCINMKSRTASSKGLSTDFVISANEVRMNGKGCFNHFKL